MIIDNQGQSLNEDNHRMSDILKESFDNPPDGRTDTNTHRQPYSMYDQDRGKLKSTRLFVHF